MDDFQITAANGSMFGPHTGWEQWGEFDCVDENVEYIGLTT